MPDARPIQAVVADDAVLLREGLCRLLGEAGIEVVGEAGDATELLAIVAETRPQLAVIDIRMPPTHTVEGLEAAEKIQGQYPEVAVLIFSQYLQASFAMRLMARGAKGVGYVLKERVSDIAEFSELARRVANGGVAIDRALIDGLLTRDRAAARLGQLSARDRELVVGVAHGLADEQLAESLGIPRNVVASATGDVFDRLGLSKPADYHERTLSLLRFLSAEETEPSSPPASAREVGS